MLDEKRVCGTRSMTKQFEYCGFSQRAIFQETAFELRSAGERKK